MGESVPKSNATWASWLAGISHMQWRTFAVWNAAGGIIWATGISLLAYWAGKAVADAISRYGLYAVIALIVIAVLGFVGLKLFQKRMVDDA